MASITQPNGIERSAHATGTVTSAVAVSSRSSVSTPRPRVRLLRRASSRLISRPIQITGWPIRATSAFG